MPKTKRYGRIERVNIGTPEEMLVFSVAEDENGSFGRHPERAVISRGSKGNYRELRLHYLDAGVRKSFWLDEATTVDTQPGGQTVEHVRHTFENPGKKSWKVRFHETIDHAGEQNLWLKVTVPEMQGSQPVFWLDEGEPRPAIPVDDKRSFSPPPVILGGGDP